MKRSFILLAAALIAIASLTLDAHARGRGGGGRGGGGRSFSGGGRSPSMSRPSAPSRPTTSRPSVQRPSVSRPTQPSRPSTGVGGTRPSTGVGGTRPSTGVGGTRPSTGVGGTRPNTGVGGTRPSTGVGGSRPEIGNPANRPSQGQLQDFLNLPGQPSQRPTRPADGSRPNISDRTRPADGGRPNINDRTRPAERPKVSDNARDRWKDRNDRPFDRNHWDRYGNNKHWHWQSTWGRRPASYWWRPCTWTAFGTWFAWSWAKPYYYDYGNTVVYQDNTVYYGDKAVATADDYYQQAENIADDIPADADPAKVEWLPLGVFALAEGDVAESGMLMQLAVSKEGIIAGTYYNEGSGSSRPLEGMVDQKTQRAAWKFSDDKNDSMVFETGIYNLTKDETTCLVHFGPEKTQTWSMIRLPPPEDTGEPE